MIVIRRYKDSGEWVKMKYPRWDNSPIENLDSNIEFYTIQDNIPSYDSSTEYIVKSDVEFTDTPDSEHSHLKVAIQNYTVHDIPQTETITITP